MSRPRQHYSSLDSKSDVIDFIHNQSLQLQSNVVGGPPAFLEAHGIRYVPEGSQPKPDENHDEAPVPMNKAFQAVESVDEKIRRYLARESDPDEHLHTEMRAKQLATEKVLQSMKAKLSKKQGKSLKAHSVDDDFW